MAKIDEPVKCACGTSFVRTHPRQRKCPKCQKATGCGYCHRVDGHSASCPRAGTKAKKATGGGNGARPSTKTSKKKPKPGATMPSAMRDGGIPTDGTAKDAAKTLLSRLHAIRSNLDTKITAVEELIGIL